MEYKNNDRNRTKTTITPAQLLELGKLPPQAVDLEEAVLGACMLDREGMESVEDILKPESFYKEANQRIFFAAHSLYHRNEPVDIMTVTQELKKMGELDIAGGVFYVTQLTNRVSSAANVFTHAMILKEKFMQRELIRYATNTLAEAYEDTSNIFEMLEKAEQGFMAINEQAMLDSTQTMSQVMRDTVKEIEGSIVKKGITGVVSGFPELDGKTGGWQRKTLIILASRPMVGKSTLMLNCSINSWNIRQEPSLIFSLEMNKIQLGKRAIASESGVSYDAINKGRIDKEELVKIKDGAYRVGQMPIYIIDRGSMSTNQMKAIARKYVRKFGVKQIWVDYLQKVKGSKNYKGNREQEVSDVTNELKAMAKTLNVPVIALCMLGRSVEERKDKVPTLADLRESGQIEAEADTVVFLYRPAIGGAKEDIDGKDLTSKAKLIIAKNREGLLGEIKLEFKGDESKFIPEDTQLELMPLPETPF